MKGKVSIITPCYNAEKFISQTIKSVQAQTYENWEMLIVDDFSKDSSIAIVEEFIRKDSRIKLFKVTGENKGPAVARNMAIENATGQFLAFLDSDDLWDKIFLETSIEKIKESEGFVFASYRRCDENTLDPVFEDFIVPEKVTRTDILKTNSISCLTAFIDMGKLGKEYMPLVLYRQDMGLWLKYLKKVKYAYGIKEPLASYRIRIGSHSRNKKKLLYPQWYFYRNVENLSVWSSLYYYTLWAYNGFMKYRN